MKQKKIGDILYVFDDVPYYIQEDTDATTIYVQEEYLGGYKELNPALAFTPYNYRLLRVTKPEWADYINADDEPVEDEGYSPDAMDLNGRSFMMSSFPNGDIGIAIGIEEGASSSHSISVDRSELEEQMQGIGASDDNEDDDLVGEYDSDFDPTEVRSEKSVPLNSKIIVTKQGYGQYSFKVPLGSSDYIELLAIDYSDTTSETGSIIIDNQTNADVLVFGLMNKQEIVPEKEPAGISFVSDSASIDLKDDQSTSFELINPNDLTGLTAYASDPSCDVQLNNNIVYVTPSTTGTYTIYVEFAGDENYLPSTISATLTVADTTPAPSQPIDYPVSLAESDIQVDNASTASDIQTTIVNNLSGYSPNSWGVWPYVTIVDQGSSTTIADHVEMYSQSLVTAIDNALANVSYGTTVWTVTYDIQSTTYAGQEYNAFNDSCTFTFVQVQQDQQYGCSLLNNDIQFDPDVSAQDIEDAITGNLSGHDSSWMPEPNITVKFGAGNSDFVCQDTPMSQLDFSINMSSITFGTTVWTVYYTIAADDYAGEHYAQQDLEFTISFVDYAPQSYPVSLASSTAEVEYEDGSSDYTDVYNALDGLVVDYDDTWMPAIHCTINAPDPNDPMQTITITDNELNSPDFNSDIQAAFQESGAIVADQTQWQVHLTMSGTEYAGITYTAWNSGEITLSFVSPAVEPLGHLRLTANENGSTIAMQGPQNYDISLEYTTDEGATWNQWDLSAITLNEGESVCFRGINDVLSFGNHNDVYSSIFIMTGNINASGHVMSLLFGDNYESATLTTTNQYCFNALFKNCTALYDVSEIIMPPNVVNYCFYGMFYGCTNIERAPYLPGDEHYGDMYHDMFRNCAKLNYVKFNNPTVVGLIINYSNWLLNVSATGILVNKNPNFNPSKISSGGDGIPSGWTFLTSDPQDYDASINNSNIDIYPSGESVPYANISDIVTDIQNNFTCTTVGATPSIIIPDPNDQGGSNFVINNIELDNGPDLETAIDTYRQNHGINIGDVWTATISIPQATIDGTLYLAWQGTFTISFQDNP